LTAPAREGCVVGKGGEARARCFEQLGPYSWAAGRHTGRRRRSALVVRRVSPVARAQSARGLPGDGRSGGIEQDAVERGQRAEDPQEAGELDGHPPPTVPSYNANSTSPGGAVGLRVAGGEDGPAVWQAVFAQGAIEHQLVAGGPHQRRRGVQFVEEQDAGTVPRTGTRGWP
jgi:hypothetical protein